MSQAPLGWSFLIARGRYHGYRTVLAPDFLTERNRHSLLTDSISGANLGNGRQRTVTLQDGAGGSLTAVCVTEQLSSADLGANGNGLATDEHGRPLEALYGVVSRDRLSGRLDDADLSTARAQSLESYRRFLCDEDSFRVDSSRCFALRSSAAAKQAPPRTPATVAAAPPAVAAVRDRARREDRRPPRPGIVALAAVAGVVALAVAWQVLRDGAPDPTVTVKTAIKLPSGPLDCTRPLTLALTATITTDKPGAVRYRWNPAVGKGTSGTLTFARKGSKRVRAQAVVTPAGGAVRGRTYSLLVDKPVSARGDARHAVLPCRPVKPAPPPAKVA